MRAVGKGSPSWRRLRGRPAAMPSRRGWDRAGRARGRQEFGVARSDAGSFVCLRGNSVQAVAFRPGSRGAAWTRRSEEHTSELQSLMRISYAVFCLKKNKLQHQKTNKYTTQHNESTH